MLVDAKVRKAMKRKWLSVLLAAALFCLSASPTALAEPDTGSPTPTPATGSASVSPSATPVVDEEATLCPELLKNGSRGDYVMLLQMRLRDLGYYNYKITGVFGAVTENAVNLFQKNNGLVVDGAVGQKTAQVLYSNQAQRTAPTVAAKKPAPTVVPTGKLWDWYKTVNKSWPKLSTRTVRDVYTGKTYKMTRVGGSNHADVEPATKADCDIFKSTYGGSWSWDRRPVIVSIGGTWVAASINGMPHGYETISGNGMTNQVCIHFLNSRTHIQNMKDSDHQECVQIAATVRKASN